MDLFPKNGIFYTLFEKQAEKLKEASCLLSEILNNPQELEALFLKMKKLEEEADDIGYSIIDNLRKSFITPIEGEDIDLLRQRLDDIIDLIEKAVNRMTIYNISKPFPEEIADYIKIIKKSIKKINKGVKEIRNVKKHWQDIHQICLDINCLEKEGDFVNRAALKKLINVSQITPEKILEIIKLKEIYEVLEEAIDRCEDVGNIFESILIKNR